MPDISGAVRQGALEAQHGVVVLVTETISSDATRTHIQDRQGRIALAARAEHGIVTAHCGRDWNSAGGQIGTERHTKLTGTPAPVCDDCVAAARGLFVADLFRGLPDG